MATYNIIIAPVVCSLQCIVIIHCMNVALVLDGSDNGAVSNASNVG